MPVKPLKEVPARLLGWFDPSARALPWRGAPGLRDPYRVWLAEIMLQQTTTAHAAPYFHEFTRKWPTVEALAAAQDDQVMRAWAGLGYYARARNLLKCARVVAAAGGFPETEQGLRALPGVGPYTAGAIAALAFGVAAPAVDGNAERVFARLMALNGDWKAQKQTIAETVRGLVPASAPGAFAEALMDLGATVCTPKRPDCAACPLRACCKAAAKGEAEAFPMKPEKVARPERFGAAFVLLDRGEVWLERRPSSGLLGGMLGLPGPEWQSDPEAERAPPVKAAWEEAGAVKHVFTHFSLTLDVFRAELKGKRPDGVWLPAANAQGLPSVFAKALKRALK